MTNQTPQPSQIVDKSYRYRRLFSRVQIPDGDRGFAGSMGLVLAEPFARYNTVYDLALTSGTRRIKVLSRSGDPSAGLRKSPTGHLAPAAWGSTEIENFRSVCADAVTRPRRDISQRAGNRSGQPSTEAVGPKALMTLEHARRVDPEWMMLFRSKEATWIPAARIFE
jgi:hypothetical protein